MKNELPTICPRCGSPKTAEKYEGDDTCLLCHACGAFWYWLHTKIRGSYRLSYEGRSRVLSAYSRTANRKGMP